MDTSPTVRRRLLGQRLRAYRQAADMSAETVAKRLPAAPRTPRTPRTVFRWEAGQSNVSARDLAALLDLYGVPAADRPELLTLAREADRPGWWTPYNSALRPSFKTFLGLEGGATALSEYSAMVIPGLLQTERYMRAIMQSDLPMLDDETIEGRIAVRLKRQAEVHERNLPTHYIIDEAALRRGIGGADVMAEQLSALSGHAQSRFITVQVLPFGTGSHASILGGFTLLEFEEMGPIACTEMVGGDLFADGADSATYTLHFDKLREGALPEPHSLQLAEHIREELQR